MNLVKDYQNTIDGAESYDIFLRSVKSAFNDVSKMPYDPIAVITYGGSIKCFFEMS